MLTSYIFYSWIFQFFKGANMTLSPSPFISPRKDIMSASSSAFVCFFVCVCVCVGVCECAKPQTK